MSDRKARAVKLLVAGGTPRSDEAAGVLTVSVPLVKDHEVIAVDV